MNGGPQWFAPRRFGFGAGVPISWQGWALTAAYVGIAIVIALAFKHRPVQLLAALALPTIAFVVISCRTTRGGCRWRWGSDD